jgi:ATP-dependent RNA helicase RhlE
MSELTFAELSLAAPIALAIKEQGYNRPTEIQARAIPPQLEGLDVLGCSQTGTGKTAAFSVPILHHLVERPKALRRHQARALVLTPTRELAVQVGNSFQTYGKHIRMRMALVYGGVSQHPQTRALGKGVDVLVATPGRLLDLMEQGHVDLSGVEFLVLDEVDRMLDMGFVNDVKEIAAKLPRARQTVLFSATLSKAVESIARDFVQDPIRVRVAPEMPVVESILQEVCHVRQEHKRSLLEAYLRGQDDRDGKHATIVFCRTKFSTEKLSVQLNKQGFRTDAIHGDKSQAARQRALDGFRSGKVPVLIATDVAARGIDVRGISLVVNYDIPESADSYVHRIGRTARAEASGNAVTFCTVADVGNLRQIEAHLGNPIGVDRSHPFHDEAVGKVARPRPANNPRGRGGKGGNFFRGKRPFSRRRGPAKSGGSGKPGKRH